MVKLEICVDTIDGARAAEAGGADRVELCSALSEGGLTPSVGLMKAAADLSVPVYAMIRPRSGLFHFTEDEEAVMLADIAAAKAAGLAGVVLGAQGDDGGLDMAMLGRLMAAAEGMGTTLHRVIDVVPEPLVALEQAVELGFERVLTSGAAPEAPEGAEMVARMVEQAGDRIGVMAGCGLTAKNVAGFVAATGVREVHAACAVPVEGEREFSDFSPVGGRMRVSEEEVRGMRGGVAVER